jgi:hypothetical protein
MTSFPWRSKAAFRATRRNSKAARKRRAEADLDAGADREVDRLGTDRAGGAVALGAKHDPAVAGDDDKGAFRGEDGAGDHTQAVAESASGREPQELGRHHRPRDAEKPRDLFRRAVYPMPVILDEVAAAGQLANVDFDRPAFIKAVAGGAYPSRPQPSAAAPRPCGRRSSPRSRISNSGSSGRYADSGECGQ